MGGNCGDGAMWRHLTPPTATEVPKIFVPPCGHAIHTTCLGPGGWAVDVPLVLAGDVVPQKFVEIGDHQWMHHFSDHIPTVQKMCH